jgi:hypothetical protein
MNSVSKSLISRFASRLKSFFAGWEGITAYPYTMRFADSLRWFPKRDSGKGKSSRPTTRNSQELPAPVPKTRIGLKSTVANLLATRGLSVNTPVCYLGRPEPMCVELKF